MAGTNKFLEWDSSKSNIMTDTNYSSSSVRTGGATDGVAESIIYNKLFRNVSVMCAAWGQVFADLGYTVSDDSLNNLTLILANIITTQGGTVSGALNLDGTVTFGNTATLNADPTSNLQAATKQYVDNQINTNSYTLPTATNSVLGGVKIGNGLTMSSGALSANIYITSSSLGSNGYIKWSNGMIDQWGIASGNNTVTVTLPTSCTNNIFNVQITDTGSARYSYGVAWSNLSSIIIYGPSNSWGAYWTLKGN